MSSQKNIVYLNEEFLPIDQAMISVLDRGFLFGDGIYEVIPVFGSKPLRETEHLNRLENNLEKTGISNPMSRDEWSGTFKGILDKNPGDDRAIYLQVTRGTHAIRDLSIKEESKPTVFMMVMQIPPVDMERIERGMETTTIDDFRWHACDIKSISLIANVMMRRQAEMAGVQDAILIRDEFVTEGTASNVFIVKDGIILTPPKSNLLLPGITRDLVVELIEEHDIECEVREISKEELHSADEIWLTSSTREIIPIIRLDGEKVGTGSAGPYWRKVIDLYQAYKEELRKS